MDTIFAPVMPLMKSSINVIRISGELADKALASMTKNTLPDNRVASLRTLYHPIMNHAIDEALVLRFLAPNSFTGENVVELHVHGSIAVINDTVDALLTINGCRLAEAGEFTKRAFHNGKLDLTQVEGLADLINAESTAQHKQALQQMQGSLFNLYNKWRSDLVKLMAQLEAYVDFPDEDIPNDVLDASENLLKRLRSDINSHLEDAHQGQRIREGIHVTILGAPNVGKSSLINWLAQKDVAIVSDIAGTTRDIVEAHLDIGGLSVVFADTAGLRQDAEEIEAIGIQKALTRSQYGDYNIVMLDAQKLEDLDTTLTQQINDQTIIVINKIDQKNLEFPTQISGIEPILVSVKTGEGLEQLISRLTEKFTSEYVSTETPRISRQRHRDLLTNTLEYLTNCDLRQSAPEIAAEDLRLAARNLGKIIGIIDVEDVLDSLFSDFCIGK